MSRLTHSGTKEAKSDVTIKEIVAKLVEYEDIGVSPEQVQELAERDTAKRPDYEGDGYDNEGNLIYDTWITAMYLKKKYILMLAILVFTSVKETALK